MTAVKGGYAVDVPVINVSERARREHASVWSTFKAFGVTLHHLFKSLFKGDTPTIYYPEQTRPYSERFRGTHILTVRDDGSLKCVACYMCTSFAPAARTIFTILRLVVPRTMESSIRITRLPVSCSFTGFNFTFTPKWRMLLFGSINVRPT